MVKNLKYQWQVHASIPRLADVLKYVEAVQRLRGLPELDTLAGLLNVVVKDGLVDRNFEPEGLLHLMMYFISASDAQAEELCSTVAEWGEEEILLQKVRDLNLSRHEREKLRYPVLMNDDGEIWLSQSMYSIHSPMSTQMRTVPEVLRDLARSRSRYAETWVSTKEYPSPENVQSYINEIGRLSNGYVSNDEIMSIIVRSLNDHGRDVIQASGVDTWQECLLLLQRAPSEVAAKLCKAVVKWGEHEYRCRKQHGDKKGAVERPVLRNWKGKTRGGGTPISLKPLAVASIIGASVVTLAVMKKRGHL